MIVAAEQIVDPKAGWAHLVGFLIAVGIACGAVRAHEWWTARNEDNPSPPLLPGAGVTELPPAESGGVTPLVTPVSPPSVTGHMPSDDEGEEIGEDDEDEPQERSDGWLKRIPLADGSMLVRRVKAAYETGDATLPEEHEAIAAAATARAALADSLVTSRTSSKDAIATIMSEFRVSSRTAKRDLASARERRL